MKQKHEKGVSKEMKGTLEDSNKDYRFLRSNRICAKTALRMLALAYMGRKKEAK